MSIIIDTKYLSLLSPRLDRFKKVRDYLWNFRCPQCGDSHKSKSKARGYVYRKKTDLFFKCHNCGVGQSVGNLIKDLDPFLHKQYIMERYKAGETGKRKSKTPEFKFEPPKFKLKPTTIDLPSIGSLPCDHHARLFYTGRKIPNSFLDKVYYTDDFREWAMSISEIDYSNLGRKESRMVIPFYDTEGNLIAAQGRALSSHELRYITVKVYEDVPKVFGLERWNSDQHTYLVEGPIDSFFLPNCLAVAGADMSDLGILNQDKTTLIFDNEPRNFQIVRSMIKSLQDGWNVVIWPNSITCKDINDMVLASIKDARLVEIINTNTYSGQRGEWEVHSWKKV